MHCGPQWKFHDYLQHCVPADSGREQKKGEGDVFGYQANQESMMVAWSDLKRNRDSISENLFIEWTSYYFTGRTL